MTDLETRLERALKAEDPALRDPMFRITTLVRRERAAFRRRLVRVGAPALVAGAIMCACLVVIGEAGRIGAVGLALLAVAGLALACVLVASATGTLAEMRSSTPRWRQTVSFRFWS
jgi:hypothetical protein